VVTRYLSQDLAQLGPEHDDLQRFREVLCDHPSYRQHVKAYDGDEADTTWLGRCKPSSILGLRLLEDPFEIPDPRTSVQHAICRHVLRSSSLCFAIES
jgi:hypothetical protein